MIVRIRNDHGSHPWSQKCKRKKKTVSEAKETIRDDSGRIDRDNRSGVRELRWQATCNGLGIH